MLASLVNNHKTIHFSLAAALKTYVTGCAFMKQVRSTVRGKISHLYCCLNFTKLGEKLHGVLKPGVGGGM